MTGDEYIEAELTFIANDPLHDVQKPYELLYETEDLPTGCNFDEEAHDVALEDFRPLKGKLSLDSEGFILADLESAMSYQDFFDEIALKSKFMKEVKCLILDMLQARSVYFHECVVSLGQCEDNESRFDRRADSKARSTQYRIQWSHQPGSWR